MDRFDKFTERARKVLPLAQEEAQRFNHNYIGTEHLLLGLVREGEGVAAKVLANLGVELNKVRTAVEFIIGRGDRTVVGRHRPDPARQEGDRAVRRRGAPPQPPLHRHRAPAARPGPRGRGHRRRRAGVAGRHPGQGPRQVIHVLSQSSSAGRPHEASGSQQDPDHRPAGHRPDRRGPRRQARSRHRPREGDRAGHPDPLAPHQEQPGPDRRARRRQDGHRRGPGPAHRLRRRPRDAAGQAPADARHRLAGRRHQVPRRVRGAPQEDHRGDQEHRTTACSSSTSCTRSSAPARPRARSTRRTSSSRRSPAASCR